MNQVIYILFCVSAMVWACSEQSTSQEDSIVGTWILEKYCMSPGDSSCPWQTPDQEYTYTFDASGTYSSNTILSACTGRYEVTTDSDGNRQIRLYDHGADSGCNEHMMWLAFLENKKVNIAPMCDEECTFIYKRKN